jgi:hypothetical protein
VPLACQLLLALFFGGLFLLQGWIDHPGHRLSQRLYARAFGGLYLDEWWLRTSMRTRLHRLGRRPLSPPGATPMTSTDTLWQDAARLQPAALPPAGRWTACWPARLTGACAASRSSKPTTPCKTWRTAACIWTKPTTASSTLQADQQCRPEAALQEAGIKQSAVQWLQQGPAKRHATPARLLQSNWRQDAAGHAGQQSWQQVITQQISQCCAAWFDHDQAEWQPDRHGQLYQNWLAEMALQPPPSPDAACANACAAAIAACRRITMRCSATPRPAASQAALADRLVLRAAATQ